MKAIFTCLLTGLLLSFVGFSQTDTSANKIYLPLGSHKHFNNPFYNLSKEKAAPAASFSFLRGSELFVSPHSSFRSVTNYSFYSENRPLWKELISAAGKIAIQAYEDNHTLLHFYPNQ
jgi:hypothetical protein